MAVIKAVSSKAGIGQALDYVTKEEKTEDKKELDRKFKAQTASYDSFLLGLLLYGVLKVVCKRVYEVERILLN